MTQNMQNKSREWLTVSGRSKQAPSKHTHARVQWSRAIVGLTQARPNYSLYGLVTLLC